MEGNAHDEMDKHLAWGIEAIRSGGQVSFSRFGCDFEFKYHIVQILLPNCPTRLGATYCTVAGR